jgi:hypothetical protein
MIGQTTDPLFFLLSLPSIESFVADNTPEHHFAPLNLSVSAQAITVRGRIAAMSIPPCAFLHRPPFFR